MPQSIIMRCSCALSVNKRVNIKRWYYSTAHWQLGDVMVSDIIF